MQFREQFFPTTIVIDNVNNNFNPKTYFKFYSDWELYNKDKIYNLGFEKDSKKYEAIQFIVGDKKYIAYKGVN